jgi:DNA-binding NarL/FixJ family response regulator
MQLRLVITDDHPLLMDGLMMMLEQIKDVQMLKPVSNGRQLIDQLQEAPADIVLLDLNMPQLAGIDTLKILRKDFPQISVIILTSYYQPELVREIKALGAKGYLLKTTDTQQMKEAIAAVAVGNTWFTIDELPVPSAPPYFVDDFMKKYQLTKREVEIIRMICSGFTTKGIGEKLFVSVFTINAHRRNISRKLNINTPVGLLNFARQQGLV